MHGRSSCSTQWTGCTAVQRRSQPNPAAPSHCPRRVGSPRARVCVIWPPAAHAVSKTVRAHACATYMHMHGSHAIPACGGRAARGGRTCPAPFFTGNPNIYVPRPDSQAHALNWALPALTHMLPRGVAGLDGRLNLRIFERSLLHRIRHGRKPPSTSMGHASTAWGGHPYRGPRGKQGTLEKKRQQVGGHPRPPRPKCLGWGGARSQAHGGMH